MIEGKFAEGGYWAQLCVPRSVETVWSQLLVEEGGEPIWLKSWPRMGDGTTVGEVVEVVDKQLVRVLKHSEPCKDSQIALSLAEDGDGCSITVRQYDVPQWAHQAQDLFVYGGDQIAADLALYLQHGVSMCRHGLPWAFSGIVGADDAAGVSVVFAMPGTFAERVGLQAGDVLVQLADAPVFSQADVQTLMRVLRTGEEISAHWVRESQLMNGKALL